MADSNTADLGKGKRITGGRPVDAGRRPAQALRRRREHPLAGRRRRSARTASCTGCCRSPAPPCAAAVGPTGIVRRRESGEAPNGWVRTQRDGAVLTVTLDRPDQLNAQTPATWSTLARIGASLDDDGAGGRRPRARAVRSPPGLDRSLFSAEPGVDGGLGDLGRRTTAEAEDRIRGYQAGFRWLRSPGIVSVAAVQGHAIGAGCQLALACDLRVLADDAQLRLPEATLGLVPDLTGTSTLVELVGYSRALEICLTGRAVERAEAHAIGLANLVVPAAELDAAVADLVAAAARPRRSSASRATAELVRSAVRNDAGRTRTPPSGPHRCSGCRNSSAGSADTVARNSPAARGVGRRGAPGGARPTTGGGGVDMSHPMTSMAAMRSFRRDPSVTGRTLPKGTVRRILGIARPYRRELLVLPRAGGRLVRSSA